MCFLLLLLPKKLSVACVISAVETNNINRLITVIEPRARSAASHATAGAEIAPTKIKTVKIITYSVIGSLFLVR